MKFIKNFLLFYVYFLFLTNSIFAFSGKSLIFSEISWMGTTNSSFDEWIELKNISGTGINLNGWKIEAEDGSPNIELNGEILANSFFLLERSDDNSAPAKIADKIYIGGLGNAGEILFLKNGSGEIIDQINSWISGDNSTKETMLRDENLNWINGNINGNPQNTSDFFTENKTGTGENLIPTTGKLCIFQVLTEPQNDWSSADFSGKIGTGTISDNDEFIQIFNPNNFDINLQNWTFEFLDSSPITQNLNGIISGSGFFLLKNPNGALNNSIKINLKNGTGEIIDFIDLTGEISGNSTSFEDESIFKKCENSKIEKGEVILNKQFLEGKRHIFQKTNQEIISETDFNLNLESFGDIFYRGDDIYFNLNGIKNGFSYQIFEGNDNLSELIEVNNKNIYKIQEFNEKLYFGILNIGIFEVNFDGTNLKQIIFGTNRGFLVKNSLIYYISSTRKIYQTNLNGENKLKKSDISAKEFSLKNDFDGVYFIGNEDQNLYKLTSNKIPENKNSFTGEFLGNFGTGFFINENDENALYKTNIGEKLIFSNLIIKSKQLKIGNHSVFTKVFLQNDFAINSNSQNIQIKSKNSGSSKRRKARISALNIQINSKNNEESEENEEIILSQTEKKLNLILRKKTKITKNKIRIKNISLNEKKGDYLTIFCENCHQKTNISGFKLYSGKFFYTFPQKTFIKYGENVKILLKKDIKTCKKSEFCANKSGFVKTNGSLFLIGKGKSVFDGVCWSNGKELKGKAKFEINKIIEVGAWKGDCLDSILLKSGEIFSRNNFEGFNQKKSWKKIIIKKDEIFEEKKDILKPKIPILKEKIFEEKELKIPILIQKKIKNPNPKKYSKKEIEKLLNKKIRNLTFYEISFLKKYSLKKTYFHKIKLPKKRSRIFKIKGKSLPFFRINLKIDGEKKNFWMISDEKGYFNFEIEKLKKGKHTFLIKIFKGNNFFTEIKGEDFELFLDWKSSKIKKIEISKNPKKKKGKKKKGKKSKNKKKKIIFVNNGLKIKKEIETKIIKKEEKILKIGIITQKINNKIFVNGEWFLIKNDDLLANFKYNIGNLVKILENGEIILLNLQNNFEKKEEKIIKKEEKKEDFLDKTANFLKNLFD